MSYHTDCLVLRRLLNQLGDSRPSLLLEQTNDNSSTWLLLMYLASHIFILFSSLLFCCFSFLTLLNLSVFVLSLWERGQAGGRSD